MVLKGLLLSANMPAVIQRVFALSPTWRLHDQTRFTREKYAALYQILMERVPEMDESRLLYVAFIRERADNSDGHHAVFMYDTKTKERYACDLMPFSRLLGLTVAKPSLEHYGAVDFLAHVLLEITLHGTEELEIQKARQKLNQILLEAEETREQTTYYTVDEVFERLGSVVDRSNSHIDPEKIRAIALENQSTESRMLGVQIYYDSNNKTES